MKQNHSILVLFFVVVGFLLICQTALTQDVLRYEDDQGHLVLVDSPTNIPERYRNRVESVPSGKKADQLNAELTRLILNGGNADDLNRKFDRYLFINRWSLILFSLFFLMLFLPFFFKNSLSRMTAFICFLFLLLLFHLFVFVPKIQEKVYRFSGVVRHIRGVSLPLEAGIRYKVLTYRIHSEELPLIPINIYAQLLELKKLQRSFQVRK
ncbi:MAG: hypothetical protein GXO70_09805 [Acidobacteria bacterium]|nr:hypothetical protein [Acidobacteriota bacterium]